MGRQLDAQAESQLLDGKTPSWARQLAMASFRGVPFHTDTVDWTAGDNVVLREYPFQDLPTIFRMGAGTQEIKFAAYVIGDDYHLRRDALMDALTGDGELVHPTAGAMRVFVNGKFSVKEAPTSEGGMARFDLSFVRADARRYPVGVANTAATVASAAADVKVATADAWAAKVNTTERKAGWVSERVIAQLGGDLASAWTRIGAAAKGLGEFNTEVIGAYNSARTALNSALTAPRNLAANVASLLSLPAELSTAAARDLRDAFAWTATLSQRRPSTTNEVLVVPAVGAGLVMYGAGNAAASVPSTGARAQLARLAGGAEQLLEGMAMAAYVQAASAVELGSYDEAMAMRRWMSTQMQRMLATASAEDAAGQQADTSWYDAMLALYTAALADLQNRSSDLVRLSTYTPSSWQPVWLISYRLFGTAAYADEILAMNPHIEHPLLVPPGKALRIMRRD